LRYLAQYARHDPSKREEPEIIEYLKMPATRARLKEALLREKGTPYAQPGLSDANWTDDELLDFMMAHPILINRPTVVTPTGAKLCRPSETALDILMVLPLKTPQPPRRFVTVIVSDPEFLSISNSTTNIP
jgi:arsenate reductase (glutaredoxin)